MPVNVGSPEILDELRAVATTFRRPRQRSQLPLTAAVEAGAHQLYVLHILDDLDLAP